MKSDEHDLRAQIAFGWVILLVIQSLMIGYMIMESILAFNNFSALEEDPGVKGLKSNVFIHAVYALMPIYVYLVHGLKSSAFRWVAVAVAGFGMFFFLLHHLSHWQFGQRPDFPSHVLDLMFHAVSLWVIVNSVKWARAEGPQAEATS